MYLSIYSIAYSIKQNLDMHKFTYVKQQTENWNPKSQKRKKTPRVSLSPCCPFFLICLNIFCIANYRFSVCPKFLYICIYLYTQTCICLHVHIKLSVLFVFWLVLTDFWSVPSFSHQPKVLALPLQQIVNQKL